jgi:hypothetical protein
MRFKLVNLTLISLLFIGISLGQQPVSTTPGKQPPIDEVIKKFAAAETENRLARNNYTFTQDYDVMTIGEAGSITGRYRRVSDIVFDNKSNRFEKITYFPQPTLTEIGITKEDLQDLGGAQSFTFTIEELPKYQINYIGKEKIDEINTYVFTVKPKEIRKGERYFDGKLWVDDVDLQIVKIAGQAVPEDEKNQYPHFESYRENVDEKYWFPTYVYADDVLDFKNQSVHMKMVVKFTNYKKFTGNIKVLDDGGEAAKDDEKDNPTKPPTGEKKPTDKKVDEKKPEVKKPESTPKKPPME